MISVIVPTYNPPHLISKVEKFFRPLMTSLCLYTDFSNTKVFVVANGCDSATAEVIDQAATQGDISCIWEDEPLGFAGAVNLGLQSAPPSDFYVLLNDDCILLPQDKNRWLNMLLKPMVESPNIGVTGPHSLFSHEVNASFIVGYCMALRRKMLEQIGLFDEAMEMGYGEDIDICKRAALFGWEIRQVVPMTLKDGFYTGDFPIFHAGEATLNYIPEAKYFGEQNKNILQQRRDGDYYRLPFHRSETVKTL